MSTNTNTSTNIDNKDINTTGIEYMIEEYNKLVEPKDKNKYMDLVMGWYMREKSLSSTIKSGEIDQNKYSNVRTYSSKF